MIEFAHILSSPRLLKELRKESKRACSKECTLSSREAKPYTRDELLLFETEELALLEEVLRAGNPRYRVTFHPPSVEHSLLDHPAIQPLAVVEWWDGLGTVHSNLMNEKVTRWVPGSSLLLLHFPVKKTGRVMRLHYFNIKELPESGEQSVEIAMNRSNPHDNFRINVMVNGRSVKRIRGLRKELKILNNYLNRLLNGSSVASLRASLHRFEDPPSWAGIGTAVAFFSIPKERELGKILDVINNATAVLQNRINLSLWALRANNYEEEW
ncbi:MAG: hypothetical protein GXO00_01535 [Candidatus Diapherotrites archaeon]|nr:hypothetical protein [Candidatus Diapherotrites archaeon]